MITRVAGAKRPSLNFLFDIHLTFTDYFALTFVLKVILTLLIKQVGDPKKFELEESRSAKQTSDMAEVTTTDDKSKDGPDLRCYSVTCKPGSCYSVTCPYNQKVKVND